MAAKLFSEESGLTSSNPNLHERMTSHFKRSAEVKLRLAEACGEQILSAAEVISDSFRRGGKLLLCGNGGSAADCQHMAAELTSRLDATCERPGLPAIALTTDTSFLTAYANDYGYDGIFARQVQALGAREDVLFAISTSGNSKNVVLAIEQAEEIGMRSIGLMGQAGRMLTLGQPAIAVPHETTQHIQECHLAIEHLICELVEVHLFDRA